MPGWRELGSQADAIKAACVPSASSGGYLPSANQHELVVQGT